MLSEKEKKELSELAQSSYLREDMRRVRRNICGPFITNGKLDLDKLVIFLTEYNYFINNAPKAFHRIIDRDMRL
jgi:hypothetical protein